MTGISWLNETSNTLRSSLTDRQHPILIKCLAGVRCRSRFPEFPSKSHQSKAIEAHNNLVIEPVAIGWYVGPQIATQIHDSQRHLLALWCLNLILTTNALSHRVGLKRTLIERLKSYRTVYTHTNLKRSEPDGGGEIDGKCNRQATNLSERKWQNSICKDLRRILDGKWEKPARAICRARPNGN